METSTKISALRDILDSENTRLFVRFQTNSRYITGLLKSLNINNNGSEIRCLFSENGKSRNVTIKNEEIIDVVVFRDANFKPVFLKDFEAENKMQQFSE